MAFLCNLQMFLQEIYQKLQKILFFRVFRGQKHEKQGVLSFSIPKQYHSYSISIPQLYQSFSIKTVAYADIPSIRPVKPSRSVVVALIETLSISVFITSARQLCIAGMCGLSFGRSAHTVASTLPRR